MSDSLERKWTTDRRVSLPMVLMFVGQTLLAGVAGGVAYGNVMAATDTNAVAINVNADEIARVAEEATTEVTRLTVWMRRQGDSMRSNEKTAAERNARLARIEGLVEGIAANLNRLLSRKEAQLN